MHWARLQLISHATTPVQAITEAESLLRHMAGQKFALAKTCVRKTLSREYVAAGHALADAADALREIKFESKGAQE